eukprot:2752125-Amphidinium_carterae.2
MDIALDEIQVLVVPPSDLAFDSFVALHTGIAERSCVLLTRELLRWQLLLDSLAFPFAVRAGTFLQWGFGREACIEEVKPAGTVPAALPLSISRGLARQRVLLALSLILSCQ